VLKGIARVSSNTATVVQQKQLERLLTTSRKVRATSVTQDELKVAAAGLKATKKSAATAAKAAAASAEAKHAAAIAPVLGAGSTAEGTR
jgi:hypothetical protein